jgi:hypothetical protein
MHRGTPLLQQTLVHALALDCGFAQQEVGDVHQELDVVG